MEQKYSIIREQGEFMEPIALDEKDNAIVVNQINDDSEDEK